MSVVLGDRKESKYEPVWNALVMKDKLTDLCIRRFGVKDIDHMLRPKYRYYMNSRYYDKTEPINMIQEAKSTIMGYTDWVVSDTRIAYKEGSKTIESCDLQWKYIEEAIMYCELIIGKLQTIISVFRVDLNRFRPYVEEVDHEIQLLRKWKKRVKRKRNKLLIRGNL